MKSDYGKRTRLSAILNGAVIALVLQAPSVSARTLGLVADQTTRSVTVFDADTDTVLGSVPITTAGSAIGDVLIAPDQRRGFVTTFNREVFVIDLTASPPGLAGGPNPIPISNPGEDLAISPDGKFLVASDGSAPAPISVIDVASQTEISTLSVGTNTNSIDVCSNGSVLATSSFTSGVLGGTVRRLALSGTGVLTNTGEMLSLGSEPNNVFCAPGGTSGLVVTRDTDEVTSFTIPGLKQVDKRPLSGNLGISGLVNATGNRAMIRDNGGFVDVFAYNAITATLSAARQLSIPISNTIPFFGIDQMALHPIRAKLYVSQPKALKVYNANTGALLKTITHSNIMTPTGVTVVALTDPCAGPPPAGAIVGTNGTDVLAGTPGNDVIFGLGGNDAIDGRGGDDLICGGPGNDAIQAGAGDDTVVGGAGNDSISGGAGNDRLRGGAGNDIVAGNAGDDMIDGGAGQDSASGGIGKDIVNGGAGDDVLSVVDNAGGDTVDGGTHVNGDNCAADPGDTVRNCNP
ncbi:hypothetical protein ACWJKU_18315 [Methylocaldum sp. MU1018]